jgi:hypothetical protein
MNRKESSFSLRSKYKESRKGAPGDNLGKVSGLWAAGVLGLRPDHASCYPAAVFGMESHGFAVDSVHCVCRSLENAKVSVWSFTFVVYADWDLPFRAVVHSFHENPSSRWISFRGFMGGRHSLGSLQRCAGPLCLPAVLYPKDVR